MFGSSLLDVAIGTIFVFLLLSLVCSAINEIAEAWLKRRASYLERGIREMLGDPAGRGLTQLLYDHPLVSALFQGEYDPNKISDGAYKRNSNLPAYIPSRNFALALMDIILPAQAAGGAVTPSGAAGATPAPADPNVKVELPAPVAPEPPGAPDNPLTPLRNAVGLAAEGRTRTALLALLDAAGNDAAKARENIESWYNSSMDRVAGMYKRRAQWVILMLGLGVAIALNADTVYIVRALSNDATLRASLVAAAQEYAKQPAPDADSEPDDRLKQNLKTIQGLGLPIGWSKVEGGDPARKAPGLPFRDSGLGDWVTAWARLFYWHWLGWLLTAAAISQGAPFWFDLLNKIIVIRSTVKPHEKSLEEHSKE
jgi:hypothetical protein